MLKFWVHVDWLRRCETGLCVALFATQAAAFSKPASSGVPHRGSAQVEPRLGLNGAAGVIDERPRQRPAVETSRAETSTSAIPLLLFVYTSQVQLGGLALVNAPAVGVATEFPRWSGATTSLSARWRGGFEHNTSLHNRFYVGIAPVFEWAPLKVVAFELGLNVTGVLLRSLWHPFHFDETSATWKAGEGSLKFASELGIQGGVWWTPEMPARVGVFYGFSVLYPVSPDNDVPFLPLTKLGLAAAWTFEQ